MLCPGIESIFAKIETENKNQAKLTVTKTDPTEVGHPPWVSHETDRLGRFYLDEISVVQVTMTGSVIAYILIDQKILKNRIVNFD